MGGATSRKWFNGGEFGTTLVIAAYTQGADGGPALVTAARWIEGVMFGPAASIIAMIAVAGLGFLLLAGRVDLRRGATVVLGCFILFGAPVIAGRLYELATFGSDAAAPDAPLPSVSAPAPLPPGTKPPVYDPYAGASVPVL